MKKIKDIKVIIPDKTNEHGIYEPTHFRYRYYCRHCGDLFFTNQDPQEFGCVCSNCDTGERNRFEREIKGQKERKKKDFVI